MTFEFVKVIGERNTGTNFVNAVLELSVEAVVLVHRPIDDIVKRTRHLPEGLRRPARESLIDRQREAEFSETFGWKHSALRASEVDASPLADRTFFLCLSRNPFAFLKSLFRKPHNHVYSKWDSFGTFLRTPWLCNRRDKLDDPLLETPVDLWNLKYASYMEFLETHERNARLFRYEDIMLDPTDFGARIGEFIKLKAGGIVIPSTSVKNDCGVYDEYRKKLIEEDPRATLDEDDISFITSRLDKSLCESLYPGIL